MELPGHGRPAAAGDDGRLRRFPDPPPPPHARGADALQEDAALARRRDELLMELYAEQNRLYMIFRELVETEHAMAARSGPARQWPVPTGPWSQDRCQRRASSATTWEDAPPHQPSTCPEHPPCFCRIPSAVRPPPVYPRIERSPSPIAMSGSLEYGRSPSNQTLAEEALLPGVSNAANAGVRPFGSEFVRQEVTPEHENAVGGQHVADLEDGNGSGNQSSGQRKAAETTMVDFINDPGWHSYHYRSTISDNTAFKQHKRLGFSEPWPGSAIKKQQECSSSGATVHRTSGYVELCQPPSKQTRVDKSLVPVVSRTRPIQSASGEVALESRWDIGMEPKADVENGHGMPPLYNIGNQSSGLRKALESAMGDQIDGPVQSPRRYTLVGQGNAAYSEQKGTESCEERPGSDAKQQQECRFSGATVHQMSGCLEPSPSPRKRTPVEENLVPAVANAIRPTLSMSFGVEVAAVHGRKIGEEPKVDAEDDHGVRPFYGNRNQSSCQRKAVEPAIGAQIDKPLQQPSQSKPAMQENAAYNEQKRIESSELTPERTSSGLKRRLSAAAPLSKKQKPLGESSGTVNPTVQGNLNESPAGRLHQSNFEALQARIKPPELNIKAMPGQCNSAKKWEPVRWDGKENVVESKGSEDRTEPAASRWTCRICNAICTSALDSKEHHGGRRHRENTEAILAEFRTSYSRTDPDSEKSAYYCEVCGVRCTTETIMALHLIGRRHRETLQGRSP